MASIFKKSIVKEKVEKIVVANFDKKVAIIQSWYDAYLSGTLQQKNERQCEQEFINDIFKEVLGYTGFPAQPHTIIPQISSETSAQRPDAGLGYFDGDKKRVFAVVEIKDANTALDQSQRREGNLSPIQQAFKYKPQFKDCRFVIATNLYEIRLFQDNQLDYEIFTLKSLANPANNHFELKRFILLLSQDNFVSGRGKSKTEELLAEIRVEQEKITKKFYSEYSELRLKLMRDIWKNNEAYRDINLVADKAQKILDRIVFTSFCEDTGLLPDNTLLSVYKHAETSFSSIWDTLKGFFNAVDTGSEKLGIPNGYNGGLFHKDDALDVLSISDEACKSLARIGEYDFENELTVNILGHVFEQSITDLEEIKKKVEPDQENQKSKRKKDGIFYTPEYIVDYIVQNSLGRYLRENEERIFDEFKLDQAKTDKAYRERELKALQAYQDFLHDVKVVDPACGSGAFLVKVFDYLLEENRRIGSRIGGLFDQDQIFREILKNNIFGVDLNEESVRITQLSLWLKTAQKGKKLTYLDKNIRCGNSLIDDPNVAGLKAFSWSVEFKDIFSEGGFDVVVGNPPYTYRGSISDNEKDYFSKQYQSSEGNHDLYKYFIEKLTYLVKKDGMSSFIVPNSFLSAKTYLKLRQILLDNFTVTELLDLGLNVFDDVTTESIVFTLKKSSEIKSTTVKIQRDRTKSINTPTTEYNINLFDIFANESTFNIYMDDITKDLISKIRKNTHPLENFAYCTVGINTGYIKEEMVSTEQKDSRYHKLLSGRDIHRYSFEWDGEWIIYDPEFVKTYGHRGRTLPPEEIFIKHKILLQRTRRGLKRKLVAYLDENKFYNLNRVSNIIIRDKTLNIYYLLGVINTRLMDWYFNHTFNEYEVKPIHIRELPILVPDLERQNEIASLAREINNIGVSIENTYSNFVDIITPVLGLERLSRKSKSLDNLSFSEFIKLNTVKNNIDSLNAQKIFLSYKDSITILKEQYLEIDWTIERLVMECYQVDLKDQQTVFDFYKELK